jgi:hypothetical protein
MSIASLQVEKCRLGADVPGFATASRGRARLRPNTVNVTARSPDRPRSVRCRPSKGLEARRDGPFPAGLAVFMGGDACGRRLPIRLAGSPLANGASPGHPADIPRRLRGDVHDRAFDQV